MLVSMLLKTIKIYKSACYALCAQNSVHGIRRIGGMLELHLKDGLFLLIKALVFRVIY